MLPRISSAIELRSRVTFKFLPKRTRPHGLLIIATKLDACI